MSIHFVSPRIGWCREAVLERWLADDGEWVTEGHPICLLRTEHSLVPVLALQDGFFHARRPLVPPGTRTKWGMPLGTLLVPGAELSHELPPQPAFPVRVPCRVSAPVLPEAERPSRADRGPRMSPRARRLVDELNIDLSTVTGSGRQGRIRVRDLEGAGTKRRRYGRGQASGGRAASQLGGVTRTSPPLGMVCPPFQFTGTWELQRGESPPKSEIPQEAGNGKSEKSSSATPLAANTANSPGLVRLLLAVGRVLNQSPLRSDISGSDNTSGSLPIIHLVSGRVGLGESSLPSLTERWITLNNPGADGAAVRLREQLEAVPGKPSRHQRDAAVLSIVDLADGPVDRFTPPIPTGMLVSLAVGSPQQQVTAVAGKLQLRWTRQITLVADSGRVSFDDGLGFFRNLFEIR